MEEQQQGKYVHSLKAWELLCLEELEDRVVEELAAKARSLYFDRGLFADPTFLDCLPELAGGISNEVILCPQFECSLSLMSCVRAEKSLSILANVSLSRELGVHIAPSTTEPRAWSPDRNEQGISDVHSEWVYQCRELDA
jgi:hypothetical protein